MNRIVKSNVASEVNYNGTRMFNGRRIDLEQLAGQARALWLAREGVMARSRVAELFSHAAWLSLFIVILTTANQLAHFHIRAVPALTLPFAVIGIALLILRRINIQINLPLAVQLPFDAAPLMQRLSLRVTEWVARAKALLVTLPVPQAPNMHLDQSAAVDTITLFVQRVSRNWLEVRALIELLWQQVSIVGPSPLFLLESSLVAFTCPADLLNRQPQVVVLRC